MREADSTGRLGGKRRRQNITAADLGIDLASGREDEQFKWFLACLLFGKPIQQAVARRAYEEFVKEGLVTPEAILEAGWDRLVAVLDRGRYVRYDFSTATKLLEVCRTLKERYGSLANLLGRASSPQDLVARLLEFKGIGPVTARIFLRGMRGTRTSK
ncbi:MAG: DNA methylase [Armatimonadota bacterium]|nr:DNA methylase [Armatimonadota bacterium]